MSNRPVLGQMYIQPIRLEILRSHTPMLNDSMLLGQILLCEARRVRGRISELLANKLVHPIFLLVIAFGAARAHEARDDEGHGG